jgi:hypothetical protein
VTTLPRVATPRVPRPPSRWSILLVLVAGLATACGADDVADDEPAVEAAESPLGADTPDPARDHLVREVDQLRATVAGARERLAPALEADDAASARRAGREALELLVAPPGPDTGEADEVRPLFPAESLGRDEITDAPDQLTRTHTAARDVGGPLGRAVVELLRDPVAGDLGAWERDAAGVLVGVEAVTEGAGNLEELEFAVTELEGLGTQAIAWAQLTAEAGDTEAARAYAERGLASLDTITVGIEMLEEDGA